MQGPPDWWKKWKPLRWLAGIGALAALGGAVAPYFIEVGVEASPEALEKTLTYSTPSGTPVALLDQFKSYDKPEQVEEALSAAGYAPTLTRNRKPRSKNYPPRDLDSLVVINYKHLGVEGRLDLVFFNGALMQAIFDVYKAAPYAEALGAAEPGLKRDRLGTAELRDGDRRVLTNIFFSAGAVGRAAGSEGWAMWQDTGLVKLASEWEAQFGLVTP